MLVHIVYSSYCDLDRYDTCLNSCFKYRYQNVHTLSDTLNSIVFSLFIAFILAIKLHDS